MVVQIDTDDETDSLVPKQVGGTQFLGAPVRLGATGSHVTSHLLQIETFVRFRLSGTSAGKRTWPLDKNNEERTFKKRAASIYQETRKKDPTHVSIMK